MEKGAGTEKSWGTEEGSHGGHGAENRRVDVKKNINATGQEIVWCQIC